MSSQVVVIAANVLPIVGTLLPIDALDCFQQAGFLPSAPPGSAQVGAFSDNIFTCQATVGQAAGMLALIHPRPYALQCYKGQGGNGVCYACSNNRCNGALSTTTAFPSSLISTVTVLSLYVPSAIAIAYLLTAK